MDMENFRIIFVALIYYAHVNNRTMTIRCFSVSLFVKYKSFTKLVEHAILGIQILYIYIKVKLRIEANLD